MKRPSGISLILAGIFLCGGISASGQQNPQFNRKAQKAYQVIVANHISDKVMNDKSSAEVFRRILKELDPDNLIFRKEDYTALSKFSSRIDDEVNGKSWDLIPVLSRIYKTRLEETLKIIETSRQTAIPSREKVCVNDTALSFPVTPEEKIARWQNWIQYKIYCQKVKGSSAEAGIKRTETDLRTIVIRTEKRKLNRILNHPEGLENYLFSVYMNCIAAVFDPHTTYFSESEWKNFESLLSANSLSFGLEVGNTENDEIEIVSLVPGGPAWKSNELNKGDIITKVKWQGKQSADLDGADMYDVSEYLSSQTDGVLELTVRKPEGAEKTVLLKKEIIRDEENIVRSYVLNGKRKIGYITLPGFYTEWENKAGSGCANDVAGEILKLKNEGIEGIILDIRNNGGGALAEGLNLAGIFINEGPLLMLGKRDGKPVIVKDPNRGTVYDGPLLLMVNGLSASASEVVAATLQDYNRALIAGSPTYGKATGQIILPADSTVNQEQFFSGKTPGVGALKVTTEKLYRVTGKSVQLKGVIPDIMLPDLSASYEKESDCYNPVRNDSVVRKVYYTPLPSLPVPDLLKKSKARTVASRYLGEVNKANQIISEDFKSEVFSVNLCYDSVAVKFKRTVDVFSKIESLKDTLPVFEIKSPETENTLLSLDEYTREMNEYVAGELLSDVYLKESYFILSDLITIRNGNK
jgi:carboxyl-terminal processing protease